MIRAVFYIFLAIVLITFLRSIVGVVAKVLSGLLEPGAGARAFSKPRKAGELKRDPVCGTYVSTATSIKKTIGGEVVYFCSAACSEKYQKKA